MNVNMENYRQLSRKILILALNDASHGYTPKDSKKFFEQEMINLFCDMAGLNATAYEKKLLTKIRKGKVKRRKKNEA